MLPALISAIIDTPGIYKVTHSTVYWLMAVTAERKCYQLNPRTLTTDGFLSEDGWNEFCGKIELYLPIKDLNS